MSEEFGRSIWIGVGNDWRPGMLATHCGRAWLIAAADCCGVWTDFFWGSDLRESLGQLSVAGGLALAGVGDDFLLSGESGFEFEAGVVLGKPVVGEEG